MAPSYLEVGSSGKPGAVQYCGCAMLPASDKSSSRCTAEHLRARCDGGKDVLENVVAACWLCNNRRHRRKVPPAPEDYKRLVRNRISRGRWIASASAPVP
ncbi:HNH endonuclease signature motif containing protein [Devosia sp.]|uniref:HNH endonuclease signature motif containing protein n=1 Tax=Devosia sp. TaxID=1871048 RepID=UPI003A598D20